ncbi:polymer-forming cytoskeletal [Clostridium tepidiprofundi DSM 19306]|uniref:Polymer-forming cytoskeletal n=1 Tax=Clostridium tepidiprofundi DSM 19306 TaxID=1121338 RepID=A0A151AS85_9CLOT|nr:polymer-forming cytoskeletal protein [Clostridium tepidiprofundi]KYH30514.1 polymer-forming cytoskeletal [Clostridium tepidiprofundi DSM 19306]
MFKKGNNDYIATNSEIKTLIGEQCNIIGSLNGTGLIKIDGYVDGDIYWDEDIIISETCTCKGNITCTNANISGKVLGNITCKDSLIINNSGKINGNILVKKLIINEGGILNGKCEMALPETSEEVLNNQPQNLNAI